MSQFRIRDLLVLILFAGVVLIWVIPDEREIPARRLLEARDLSKSLGTSTHPIMTLPPFSDSELVSILKLKPWAEIEEWQGSPFSPLQGTDITVNVSWLDDPVSFHWTVNPDDTNRAFDVVWNANWEAIKNKQIFVDRLQTIRQASIAGVAILLLWLIALRDSKMSGKVNELGK